MLGMWQTDQSHVLHLVLISLSSFPLDLNANFQQHLSYAFPSLSCNREAGFLVLDLQWRVCVYSMHSISQACEKRFIGFTTILHSSILLDI